MNDQLRERLLAFSTDKDIFNKAKQLLLLRKEYQLKIKDIADVFQVKSSYICQLMRLNRLPEMIKDGYYGKQINISLLFIISRLRSEQDIVNAYEKILQSGFSVAQTESLVREILYKIKDKGDYLNREEIKGLFKLIKDVNPDLMIKFRQTKIKTLLRIEMKGNLETTSTLIRRIIS
ncbi:hypothetical protein COS12_02880 [Candidatus Roizmanbacteria bacterium CG01_land_8_20_14_3_00_33_9]|uniref:ParB/Spo0J HTH domain-containing protein n=1 Tax=Candidatus Roizmanbacteria bacterium CG01_land_8_20_14_3_00_33_9 TaxID=1974843 RepID=A0A2M7E3K9_9BACT|nr:MAG: hypothetical protein COS12_02880 [Candidatus Roizmanbacteria bacterium CG01_land_8_20_14_3_00_33_9]